ncbi:MAG TPA: dihydroneopterin aldolase [Actinomycetota bacterium]|nr:dihydroneopterin aldolase [Actinomycetota bacterium]
MTASRLFLSGIHASGRAGVRPGEQDEPQPFVIDLDLELDVADDNIDATADYRTIMEAVREVVVRGSFDLIETMARAIADRVATFPHVTSATAVIHKPNAATSLGIDGVAAAATSTGGSAPR